MLTDKTTEGVHHGMTYAEYEAIPALRQSLLCAGLPPRTMAHLKWEADHPRESTPDMDFGQLLHTMILEPGKTAERFMAYPAGNKNSNAYKDAFAAARAENPEATFLDAKKFDAALDMRRSILADNAANKLLREFEGHNEAVLVWRDWESGLSLKARLDRLIVFPSGEAIVVDLKTVANADPQRFRFAVRDWRYDVQAAWYLAGVKACLDVEATFVFVAAEKSEPYLTACYCMGHTALAIGADSMRDGLRAYAECKGSGAWPGYGNGSLMETGLPEYIERKGEINE